MEHVTIKLDDAAEFDRLVHDGLPEGCDLQVVTKDAATEGGNPAVVVAFSVQLPDGSIRIAQCVTTARNVVMAAAAIRGRYPHIA